VIVFGPNDADLNGAPDHWRQGNWRPRNADTATEQADTGSLTSIPLDWCDKVLEYDARFGGVPGDGASGTQAAAPGVPWTHASGAVDPAQWFIDDVTTPRALRFNLPASQSRFFTAETALTATPVRAAGYGVVMVDTFGGNDADEGFELRLLANQTGNALQGARGVWADKFRYVKLDSSLSPQNINSTQPVDQVFRVWHEVAFDANVTPSGTDDKTINSLDNRLNHDDRTFFGSVSFSGTNKLVANFGKRISTDGGVSGRLRNFVVSAPGRFIRAGFRGFATQATMRLKLVLVADTFLPAPANNQVALRVRFASRAAGSNPFAIPTNLVTVGPLSLTANQVTIAQIDLSGLSAFEPVWFTVERQFGVANETRGTVHLMEAVLMAAGS